MENLFVYGSLKKGKSRHKVLEGTIQMGKALTFEEFCMYDGHDFPFVTEDEVSKIHGEVYRIDETILEQIDNIEGWQFERIKIAVQLEGSGTCDAWMYVCVDEDLDGALIHEGIWR